MTIIFKLGDEVAQQGSDLPLTIEAILGKKHESAVCSWQADDKKLTGVFEISRLSHLATASTLNEPSAGKYSRYEDGLDPRDISVQISELLVATTDETDAMIPGSVQEVLRIVREKLNMDVVFVSEFIDDERVIRQVDSLSTTPLLIPGQVDLLEATWCRRIVDGRLPHIMNNVPMLAETLAIPHTDLKIGSHIATPIVLSNGKVYGTFCCFSARVDGELVERDLKNLQLAAKFTAEKLEKHGV